MPTRSEKYRIYRRSKYRFPTVFSQMKNQSATPGHERARQDVQRQIGRQFKDGTKTAHISSQWVWKEPR